MAVSFVNPEFLWLTPAAVVVGWWLVRRRRPALRYADLRLTDGLPGNRGTRAKWGGAVLRAIAVFGILVAAAGPRTPDERTPIPVEGISIVLVLDVSGSMAENTAPPGVPRVGPDRVREGFDTRPVSRLDAAKQAFRLFVSGGDTGDGATLPGRHADQIGLVTFAAAPQTACPLTLEHGALLSILDEQKPRDGLDAGTNIGDALAEGVIRLDAAGGKRKKVLILLSDGEHNIDREGRSAPLKPRQAAQLAANLNIPVYAIDAGGDPPPIPGPAADQRTEGRRTLEAVARMTDGRYFAATDAAEMRAAYREIDQLQRVPVVGPRYRRYHDYGPWVAAVAIAVLAAAGLLERTAWRRVP